MAGLSDRALTKLAVDGEPEIAALASELLKVRRALREESIRCAEVAGKFSSEASGAIRERAQLRENGYSLGATSRAR